MTAKPIPYAVFVVRRGFAYPAQQYAELAAVCTSHARPYNLVRFLSSLPDVTRVSAYIIEPGESPVLAYAWPAATGDIADFVQERALHHPGFGPLTLAAREVSAMMEAGSFILPAEEWEEELHPYQKGLRP